MLTGSLVLDLSREPASSFKGDDRRKLHDAGLDRAPAGTRVVVLVGARRFSVDPSAVRLLAEHVDRLRIDIRGRDGETIAAWHRAILAGDLEMVA